MATSSRKPAARKPREAAYERALLRAQQEASPTGILVVDPDGRIVSYNRRFAALWGLTEEVLKARDDERALASAMSLIADSEAFRARIAAIYARPDEASEDEIALKDGRVYERQSSPVVGERGERFGRVWHFRDVTDRRRAEAALRESEARFRQVAENIREVFWLSDVNKEAVIYVSPGYEHTWGRSVRTLMESPYEWLEAIHPQDRPRVLESAKTRQAAGEYDEVYRILRPDGSVRWIRDRAFPVKDESGKVYRIAGLAEDITERRQLDLELRAARDAALASARAKSEFLANVSHELRTPLNAVIGMNELLLESTLSAQQAERAEVARDAGRGLLVLIEDLLDFARLEAGRLTLDAVDFDPREVVKEVERLLRHKAAEKGLALEVRVDPGLPAALVGDPARLRQVLINFAGNAVKFTEAGRVLIEADCPRRDAAAAVLRLRVSDTGIGIAPQTLPRLFQPFTQADASTTRRYGGTGLGLVISRQITELMGGEVGVESAPGSGSVFRFSAPFPLSGRAAAPSRPACREDVRGLRVLLVEDTPVNRRVALAQLRQLGCEADVARDGVEALAALERASYDVVLLDCAMPVMDGYTTAVELRRREGAGPRTPLVALTAGARPEDRRRCLEAGMDDHLSKPVGLDALAAALSRWGGPIDDAVLARASALVGAQAAHWRAVYLVDAARLLRELAVADAAGDGAARALAAHTLKGASAALGVQRLAALCARVEGGAPADLPALERELALVRSRLSA